MEYPIAAILAGGASRRMGRDKAFVEFCGEPMISRVINILKPVVEQTVIIANNPAPYQAFGLAVYEDTIPGMGPLSGLVTAFEKTGAEQILLVACDMPLLTTKMVKFILSHSDFQGDALVPVAGGKEQGLLAIYRKNAIEKARERIDNCSIQFDEFRRGLDRVFIGEEELKSIEPGLGSFLNVNRPEEMKVLRDIAGHRR